jgi:hypothetical protein
MMASIQTVTKSVIARDWSDVEPKVLAFAATGVTASVVIEVAGYLGFHVNAGLASAIAVVVATVAGYVKKSTVKDGIVSAVVPNVVADATGLEPVPAPVEPAPVPVEPAPVV